MLPLLYGNSPVQMTGDNVEAVVRIGELVPNSQSNNTKRDKLVLNTKGI
ncbi:MAG: hypothetical protein CM15mP126_2940 [Gammaproteobacteria bacterium]|nr:MAG: hypothetical protein CM15mP126_2940 [Gammaproteobacteria bacterium]